MVVQLDVAFKLVADAGQKSRVGVKAGDFVFVLVGHQLEQVARNRLGECRLAQRRLGRLHAGNKGLVVGRIGGVLVGREEFDTPRNQALHRFALLEFDHLPR